MGGAISKYNLKGYQLKNVIEQYNTNNPKKIIKNYKYKNIPELDKLIETHNINIKDYKIIDKNPIKRESNLLKKAGIKTYSEEHQEQFLQDI